MVVYTRCQTVCLSLGSTFQQLQAALQADPGANVRLLSVSFDPRDTSADLRAYAARLKADAKHWRFVRGVDPQQTAALLSAFEVVVVPDGRGDLGRCRLNPLSTTATPASSGGDPRAAPRLPAGPAIEP